VFFHSWDGLYHEIGCLANKISGQDYRRHPEIPPYRCFLSDLTGFKGLRRAGPTRTRLSILQSSGHVNKSTAFGSQHPAGQLEKKRPSLYTLIQLLDKQPATGEAFTR